MRTLVTMPCLGFALGLLLALTSGTLQAWLTTLGLDIRTIGVLSLVGLPYTVKFLWAPFMDRFAWPWLGRRRGWMLVTQIGEVPLVRDNGGTHGGCPYGAPNPESSKVGVTSTHLLLSET